MTSTSIPEGPGSGPRRRFCLRRPRRNRVLQEAPAAFADAVLAVGGNGL
jgi:hypothetical protein